MILVTGAAGKTGRAIIRALTARGEAVRALVHRQVEGIGTSDIVVGDMRAPEILSQAMHGIRSVYFICPNMSPDEIAMGQIAIKAARVAQVEHFVYHSVLHPQVEAMPHHWQKMRVEEQLFESGLAYTLLQPAAYMQNILAFWEQILQQGVYPVPYRVDARLSLIDLEDVAAAAATVLTQSGHIGATYELVGTRPLPQTDVAAILAQQLGHPVRVEVVIPEDWKLNARKTGLGDYQVETLVKMFRYYDRYGFPGNPNVLSWLLGRSPITLADFVERTIKERTQQ